MRNLLLLSPLFLLAGCNSVVDDPYLKTVSITPDAPALATSVSPDQALASVPLLSGKVSAVRQTLGTDQVEQTIVLPNATDLAGENAIYVVAGRATNDNGLLRAPSVGSLQAEMRDKLSGVAMTISPVIADNGAGVFGFATGAVGSSGSCLYAWQATRGQGSALKGGYATQVRLRFCHPSIGEDRIAGLMKSLTIREVTPQTFASLRSGNAIARQPAFGAAPSQQIALTARDESVLAADRPVVASVVEDASPVIHKRRKPLRVARVEAETEEPVVETARQAAVSPEPAAKDMTIRNAVKIPLPGETSGTTETAVTTKPVVAAVNKGTFVPLPVATTGN